MTTETDSKYPSWRDALFSDDTIANIRCAIKYVFWHASYALLTMFVLIAGLLASMASLVNEKIPSSRISSGLSSISSSVGRVIPSISNSTKKRLSRAGVVTMFVAMVGTYIMLLVINPVLTVAMTAMSIGAIALIIVLDITWNYVASRLSESDRVDSVLSSVEGTGSKAKQIPGVRRVYGECPVHMDLEPKWFDDMVNK